MSKAGQTTLIQHLTDIESLEVLAREGLLLEAIPAAELRLVVSYALDYYFRGGRLKAPSVAALRSEEGFAHALDDNDVDLEEEPEDTIEWAIDALKATYIHRETQKFNKDFASLMSEAMGIDRLGVLNQAVTDLAKLSMDLERKDAVADVREAMAERVLAYEARALDPGTITGMSFGWQMVDEYSRGIRNGELAILAAGPKTGKSFFLAWVALNEWRAGRIAALYSLENSVEMTLDRIACLATGINAQAWERGECDEREIARVQQFQEELAASEIPLLVLKPEPGKRTAHAIVRDAQLRGAQSLLIDQLTFMEVARASADRHLQIREVMHDVKTLISTGREQMPCLMAHQISRDGVKAAEKAGHLEMYHLAEGSEVERTADWAFGLFRSRNQVHVGLALLQTLAARRVALEHFEMAWDVSHGNFAALRTIEIGTGDGE